MRLAVVTAERASTSDVIIALLVVMVALIVGIGLWIANVYGVWKVIDMVRARRRRRAISLNRVVMNSEAAPFWQGTVAFFVGTPMFLLELAVLLKLFGF